MEEMLDAGANVSTLEQPNTAQAAQGGSSGTSSQNATVGSQLPKASALRKLAHGLLSLESVDSSHAIKLYPMTMTPRITSHTLEHFCRILEISPLDSHLRGNKKKVLFELVMKQVKSQCLQKNSITDAFIAPGI
jgi:DNA-binding Xre family transcriptional regulator